MRPNVRIVTVATLLAATALASAQPYPTLPPPAGPGVIPLARNTDALRPPPSLANACGRRQPILLKPKLETHLMGYYPPAALKLHQEGITDLLVRIDKDGIARQTAVVVSSGSSAVDEGSIKAVRDHWRWEPPPPECADMGVVKALEISWTFLPTHIYQRIFLDDPNYPETARRAAKGGKGGLGILVDQYGKIIDANVTTSAGSPDLDQEMLTIAKSFSLPNPDGKKYLDRQQMDLKIEFVPRRDPSISLEGLAALAEVTPVIESRLENEPIYIVRAMSYAYSEQYDKAISDANEAVNLAPNDPNAFDTLGEVHLMKSDSDDAIKNFSLAITLNPSDPGAAHAYRGRARAYNQKRQFDQAVTDASMAITLRPGYGLAYVERACAFEESNRADQAVSDATEALKTIPNSYEAYFCRGYAYLKKEQFDPAIADAGSAIALDAKDGRGYFLRGTANLTQKHFKDAIADFTQEIQLNPSPLAYFERAMAYAQSSDYANATPDIDKAHEMQPDNSAPVALKGLVLEKEGKRDDAIDSFRVAVKLNSSAWGTSTAKAGLQRLGVVP